MIQLPASLLGVELIETHLVPQGYASAHTRDGRWLGTLKLDGSQLPEGFEMAGKLYMHPDDVAGIRKLAQP